jgi:hypothetical protein
MTSRLKKAMERLRQERVRDVERLEEEAKQSNDAQTRAQKSDADERVAASWQSELNA